MDQLEADDPPQIGPYLLVKRLGEGGMGRVYLGHSVGGRLVAVKVIRPELANDRGFRARFRHEVTAARRVNGFYTAAVVDADADPSTGPPWLATAYVAGPSLAKAIDARGPLPERPLRLLAAGLAEALRAIHSSGMVHRDLKPGNVLLAMDGPRVIDFGIARATDLTRVMTSGVIGTAAFMAPEQAEGREVTFSCDVFALGAVLAYAATARFPFGEGLPQAVIYRIVHAEPDLDGIADESLRELIAGCLAKDTANRPTAEDILDTIGFGPDDTVQAETRGWLPPAFSALVTEYEAHAPAPRQPPRLSQSPTLSQSPSRAYGELVTVTGRDYQIQPTVGNGTVSRERTAPIGASPEGDPAVPAPIPPGHPPMTSLPAEQQLVSVSPGQDKAEKAPLAPAPRWRGYLMEPWGIAVSVALGAISTAVMATVASEPTWVAATGALVAGVCYAVTVGMGILTDSSSRRATGADASPRQSVS